MTVHEQLEQFIRVEIVFRALVHNAQVLAGIFAESRFAVDAEARTITLEWSHKKFWKLADDERAKFEAFATANLRKLGMPHTVVVQEVVDGTR